MLSAECAGDVGVEEEVGPCGATGCSRSGLINDGAGRRVGGLEFPKSFGLGIAEEHLVGAKPGEVEYDTGERG